MHLSPWRLSRVGLCARLAAGAFALSTALLVPACSPAPALNNTRETPQAVAEAVLAALTKGDLGALRSLSVDEAEFQALVWPRLPAARPERNLTWQYVWQDLSTKSEYHMRARIAAWRTTGARVVNVRFARPVEDHGTYRIHRDTLVDLRPSDGPQTTERLFGAMIEQGGRYKVFSYVVD